MVMRAMENTFKGCWKMGIDGKEIVDIRLCLNCYKKAMKDSDPHGAVCPFERHFGSGYVEGVLLVVPLVQEIPA